uniref:Uncharacterized protein n=1 Tax=Arundo donax TaxID=35708 RepID=A0A0A9AR64_ARUDO
MTAGKQDPLLLAVNSQCIMCCASIEFRVVRVILVLRCCVDWVQVLYQSFPTHATLKLLLILRCSHFAQEFFLEPETDLDGALLQSVVTA